MKKPSVFANKIDHKLNNNEEVFTSYQEKKEEVRWMSEIDVRKKLKEIFNSPKYVYKAETIIKTKNGTLEKTIVGMNSNQLLTIDNGFININDILDIDFKN